MTIHVNIPVRDASYYWRQSHTITCNTECEYYLLTLTSFIYSRERSNELCFGLVCDLVDGASCIILTVLVTFRASENVTFLSRFLLKGNFILHSIADELFDGFQRLDKAVTVAGCAVCSLLGFDQKMILQPYLLYYCTIHLSSRSYLSRYADAFLWEMDNEKFGKIEVFKL